jgi:DNA-binding transcriptional regulator YiaG
VRDHQTRFWFKTPVVVRGSFLAIDDPSMCDKIETILIKFLGNHALLNARGVIRDRDTGDYDMKDNESPMANRSINLVTGRQLRAARTLAGMTQRDFATVLGVNERAVRFWERKHDRRPTSAPNDPRIEQALLARGVILFAEPTPGVRLAEKR